MLKKFILPLHTTTQFASTLLLIPLAFDRAALIALPFRYTLCHRQERGWYDSSSVGSVCRFDGCNNNLRTSSDSLAPCSHQFLG